MGRDSSKGKIVRMWPNLIGDGRDQVSSAWSKLLKPGVDWCMSRVQSSRLIQRSVDCCMSRVQTSRLPAGCSRLMQFQRVEQSTGVPVSRLMFVPRLKQSTGLTGQSTGRSWRLQEEFETDTSCWRLTWRPGLSLLIVFPPTYKVIGRVIARVG